MKLLAREVIYILIREEGKIKLLENFSHPFWFQSFGCLLGFDWHSSGLTTTVCGAVKEALQDIGPEVGIFLAGGKGGTSRKTPQEIEMIGEHFAFPHHTENLIYTSRIVAKVDNTALQDGYTLYHHAILFTKEGEWAIIQQGMNPATRMARRYHWLSEEGLDFVNEPHKAICCNKQGIALNMVAKESENARNICTELIKKSPDKLITSIKKIQNLHLPQHHPITPSDFNINHLKRTIVKAHEENPYNFEELLSVGGVGPKTIRSLALISEIIYSASPSYKDPVRYSFAHGGKDGHPYPVDRKTYNSSIEILREAVNEAKIGRSEKLKALRRLSSFGR